MCGCLPVIIAVQLNILLNKAGITHVIAEVLPQDKASKVKEVTR